MFLNSFIIILQQVNMTLFVTYYLYHERAFEYGFFTTLLHYLHSYEIYLLTHVLFYNKWSFVTTNGGEALILQKERKAH